MIEPEKYLSDEAVAEFDRIVNEYERPLRRKRLVRWAAGLAAAAAVALAVILPLRKVGEPPLSPLIIYEGISSLIEMNPEAVESVNAIPKGSKVLVTVHLKEGEERQFLLSHDEKTGTTSFTAFND